MVTMYISVGLYGNHVYQCRSVNQTTGQYTTHTGTYQGPYIASTVGVCQGL